MDPIVYAVILIVLVPLGVLWALAASARLRGPLSRPESKRPVDSLVTEVVPDERPSEDDDVEPGPTYSIDSAPPEPDPDLRPRD